MTEQHIGFCGYRCDLCPANTNNINKIVNRTIISKGWKTFFNLDIPEDRIICVGCSNKGNHLDADCPVRPCAQNKQVINCFYCSLFESCETLRLRADILDGPKKQFANAISKKEYDLFFRPYEGRKELQQQKRKRI